MEIIKRATAKICPLKHLLSGSYIQQEGWKPNYVQVGTEQITRINIIGLIVQKTNTNSFIIDDGTASIQVIDFSQNPHLSTLTIGDPVLVIGRPRKQEEELIIASEIITSTQLKEQPEWLIHRQQLLETYTLPPVQEIKEQPTTAQPVTVAADILTGDDIVDFIRKKDGGNGCLIDQITEYFGEDAQEVLTTLLSMGEIYEIRPGSVKVLE